MKSCRDAPRRVQRIRARRASSISCRRGTQVEAGRRAACPTAGRPARARWPASLASRPSRSGRASGRPSARAPDAAGVPAVNARVSLMDASAGRRSARRPGRRCRRRAVPSHAARLGPGHHVGAHLGRLRRRVERVGHDILRAQRIGRGYLDPIRRARGGRDPRPFRLLAAGLDSAQGGRRRGTNDCRRSSCSCRVSGGPSVRPAGRMVPDQLPIGNHRLGL